MTTATPAGRGTKGSASPASTLSKSARRWQKIKADPAWLARVHRQRKLARSERLVGPALLRERFKQDHWARERRRRHQRACEQCGELMALRYVGPRHGRLKWRRLSNRIFCDSCVCEREKARRDRTHREQYVPRRRAA